MRHTILYPRATIGNGGVTNAVWLWAEELARAGEDVTIATLSPDAGGRAVSVRLVEATSILHVPRMAKWVWNETDVLWLHSGWQPWTYPVAVNASRRSVPYVTVPHGAYDAPAFARSRKLKRAVSPTERLLLERAAAVHVFLPKEEEHLSRFAPRANAVVAPTGFRAPMGARWEGGGGYLAWFGRYDVEHKGLDLMLHALAGIAPSERPRLQMRGRDSRLGVAKVRDLVGQLGIDNWVTVGGPVEENEKYEFLSRCEAYIHPSRWECHSIALLEALSLGVPSLVSSLTNISPLLQTSNVGIVEDPRDHKVFGHAMLQVQGQPELGGRASKFVSTQFDWDASIDVLLKQLGMVLNAA